MATVVPVPRRVGARRLSPAGVRDLLLLGLTFSSGAVDAISFIALGKVFTAFMTGNIVFLGLGVAAAGGPSVARVLIAIGAFAAGVYAARRIVEGSTDSGVWPRRVTVALTLAVLVEAVFLAVWATTSGRPGSGSGDALAALFALAMGVQSGAVMTLAVPGVFTTAATATVIFLMKDVASSARASERARLAGVLVALFAGATASALLLVHARSYAPVLPLGATAAVLVTAGVAFRHTE